MTSLERVLTAISHKEPDQVPLFLLLSCYGAKELNMPIKDYFSSPENVVKAQLLMKEKYNNDCYYNFFYAAVEVEAYGGDVIFVEDGPPNAGKPFISDTNEIKNLKVANVYDSEPLLRVLEVTRSLKEKVGDEAPIIGVVMSPFSVPIMQLGFEAYLKLMYFEPDKFDMLMEKNIEFCVAWGNAQLNAGATAICYFDPLASPTMIDKKKYTETGFEIAKRTLSQINGPTATHLGSGLTLPVLDEVVKTGSLILGISENDDILKLKAASKDKICLIGNLNGLEMAGWDEKTTESKVKSLIEKAGKGGGLIISDNHGEIPYQVPEKVLMVISKTIKKWGQYPLD